MQGSNESRVYCMAKTLLSLVLCCTLANHVYAGCGQVGKESVSEPIEPGKANQKVQKGASIVDDLTPVETLKPNEVGDMERDTYMGPDSHGVVSLPVGINKVVSWADTHADYAAFVEILEMGGVKEISPQEAAKHKDTLFVTTGDYVDRGPDDMDIFNALVRMREAGFNLQVVTGNHEIMLATGDWRYRDMQRLYSSTREDLKEDIKDIMGCKGRFNSFIRDVAKPIVYVGSEAHSRKLIFTHGGFSHQFMKWAERISPSRDFSSAVEKTNKSHQNAMEKTCETFENEGFEFRPPVNSDNVYSLLKVASGQFDEERRSFYTTMDAYSYLFTKETGMCPTLSCDPTWDRTFFKSQCTHSRSLLQSFNDIKDAMVVVGHTVVNTEGPELRCPWGFFAMDTKASRMMGGGPGWRSVLIFENFGSATFEKKPEIRAIFTGSPMYDTRGHLLQPFSKHRRCMKFDEHYGQWMQC